MAEDKLIITGARENNLKNVSVQMPHHKLIVVTGLSGSGKSSFWKRVYEDAYGDAMNRVSTGRCNPPRRG